MYFKGLLAGIGLICLSPISLYADLSRIPVPDDFQTLGVQIGDSGLPVMLMFAAEDCGYCERLEADHLLPMARSDEFTRKVIIRKVMIDSYRPIKDFDGGSTSGEELAHRYDVRVTPTVMLFAQNGKRLSKKLIGYSGNEYYGWDLEKLIESAGEELKKSL
ncbi:MAG: thioredoxin fold domain-containing protein [Gammaproteobacteria bacterium]|nr:thioredoxin fold domain-containing protein [Gammaproteobacteria bacterium]